MKQIFKYTLNPTDTQDITMPEDAEVLSVAEQRDKIVVYALVDPKAATGLKRFKVVGTGHPMDNDALDAYDFISTVKLMGGQLMFHVFKIKD